MSVPIRVLFICTHNSARSQIAEALLGRDERFESFSAGTEAAGVRPQTLEVLREVGIDWSGARSKTLTEFLDQPFDYVITVCDQANEACPYFPQGQHRLHWSFPDPSAAQGDEAARLAVFRGVRDQIETRIRRFLKNPAQAAA